MDVKDISGRNRPASLEGGSRQRSIRSLTETLSGNRPVTSDVVRVDAAPVRDASVQGETRSRANRLISIGNITGEATERIRELVRSLGGIVEQAFGNPDARERLTVLEKEGNELIKEVQRIAQDTVIDGIRPLAGDEIEVELEERFGRVLKALLPDDAKEGFGVGEINFSTVDSIIQTRTAVAQAQERLDDLQQAVQKISQQIESLVTGLEVAFQNTEAARTSLRDVEEALKLASSTRSGIGAAPNEALGSVQNIDQRAIELLRS